MNRVFLMKRYNIEASALYKPCERWREMFLVRYNSVESRYLVPGAGLSHSTKLSNERKGGKATARESGFMLGSVSALRSIEVKPKVALTASPLLVARPSGTA
jgi:hypothetical protein